MNSLTRRTHTTRDPALCGEVDHWAAQEIALKVEARRGLTVGQQNPPWSRKARYMYATPGGDIQHSVVSMLLAVRRRLAALKIECRLIGAGVIRATRANDLNYAVLSTLLAIRRRDFCRQNCSYWMHLGSRVIRAEEHVARNMPSFSCPHN